MRLKNLIPMFVAVGLVAGCSQQKTEAEVAIGTSPQEPEVGGQRSEDGPRANGSNREHPTSKDTLLFRVQFAGTTALLANTNAAYLTNFAALPETAALGTQIVAQAASLPGRLIAERGARNGERGTEGTNVQRSMAKEPTPTPSGGGEILQPMFAEMLRDGFTLELRGSDGVVTTMALAATNSTATVQRWNSALAEAAKRWFGTATDKLASDTNWTAASGMMQVRQEGAALFFALGKTNANAPAVLTEIQKTVTGSGLAASNVLQIELASSLIPGPIQRSVYGGFTRLKLAVTPAEQSLKVCGTAAYASDLPKLGPPPMIPTNLVTEPAISFTMVREPGAWLELKSALRRFLPNPVPDVAFFWGGESSPYQVSMAIPFAGQDSFNNQFGPALLRQLLPLAEFMDTGSVVMDTNRAGIQWQGVPFVAPQVLVKQSGTNHYLVAEAFPPNDFPPGLTPALVERITGRTNVVLYDWEFTQLRLDTSIRVGQFVVFSSGHQQLTSTAPGMKWMQAVQKTLTGGGNTFTEITQTGPRELTLNRRSALVFTSVELFWLAHWLESANFPAANFLMPVPAAEAGATEAK